MVSAGHFQAATIEEEAQALDDLNSAFQQQVSARLQGLNMAVEFFRQAKKLSTRLRTATSTSSAAFITDDYQTLQMTGAELIGHINLARQAHESPTVSPVRRVNKSPSRSTVDSVKDTLTRIQLDVEKYQKLTGKHGDHLEQRRGSIRDLEEVLLEIDTSVRKTLQGKASPAPPSASETKRKREAQTAAIAKRRWYQRPVAPIQFSLWDRQGSVRQLRKKFEMIAVEEKLPQKTEEQKLVDKVFSRREIREEPIITQAKMKQASTVQQVNTITLGPSSKEEDKSQSKSPRPILRARRSIEMLRADKKVTQLKNKFDPGQRDIIKHSPKSSAIPEVPPLPEPSLTHSPEMLVAEDTGEEPAPDAAQTSASPATESVLSAVAEVTQDTETAEPPPQEVSADVEESQGVDETDFGFLKKGRKKQKEDTLEKKSFKSLRYDGSRDLELHTCACMIRNSHRHSSIVLTHLGQSSGNWCTASKSTLHVYRGWSRSVVISLLLYCDT